MMKECILYETEDDKKTVTISLIIYQTGDIMIDGYDSFKKFDPVEECDGYEYWLEIMNAQMTDFVATLIREHYKGDPGVMEKLHGLCLRADLDVEIDKYRP